jgi:hypothetical protein
MPRIRLRYNRTDLRSLVAALRRADLTPAEQAVADRLWEQGLSQWETQQGELWEGDPDVLTFELDTGTISLATIRARLLDIAGRMEHGNIEAGSETIRDFSGQEHTVPVYRTGDGDVLEALVDDMGRRAEIIG